MARRATIPVASVKAELPPQLDERVGQVLDPLGHRKVSNLGGQVLAVQLRF
jgi:hypothetical protein